MSRMIWNAPESRYFDTGLDRGVIYLKNVPPSNVEAVNHVFNPTATNGDLSNWVAYGVGTVVTSSTFGGQDGFLIAKSVAGSQLGMRTFPGTVMPGMTSRPSGTVVTLSCEIFNDGDQLSSGIGFIGRDDTNNDLTVFGGTVIAGAVNWTPPRNVWFRIYLTIAVKTGRNLESFCIQKLGTPNIDEKFRVRNVMLNDGALIPFFYGDTPNDLHAYEWSGEVNHSTSVMREAVMSAVPWNGLTACEERGGEGASSYYIDGRPFLFLPKPKEYQATLKAFTYPDAFSQVMGVTEVADGMYLDSQLGEAFDLSYRTLVGNGLEGVEHGYKIHLIYNAVVTPQSLSYDTLGSTVNPTEFSWDIQAVPVQVEGFRPTAHIIIDTRHMSPSTVARIEGLLYGNEETVAAMPSPQTIFDMLSFGDTIIVTDLGDGTFTIEGSYENVYMVNPGEFQVDNVDATIHGDGTFTISSTNA